MRILIAIALGCALMFEVSHTASSETMTRGIQPTTERASPANDDTGALEDGSEYRCLLSAQLCQQASQCTVFCAGGAPVCFQGCCTCSS
jgi:hypothetical protein